MYLHKLYLSAQVVTAQFFHPVQSVRSIPTATQQFQKYHPHLQNLRKHAITGAA
jgi:hypothetical protein